MRYFTRPRGRRGFTLIELLVVIAIIAILAAILFPVFAKARENARKSNCQSNLKQLGVACLSYAQDYDECFPYYYQVAISGYNDGIASGGICDYSGLVPYIKNVSVFSCPSVKPTPTYTYSSGVVLTSMYLFNYYIHLNGPPSYNNLTADVDSTRVCLMTEYTGYHSAFFGYASPGVNWPATHCKFQHSDGQNFLFVDGHVKWEPKSNLLNTNSVFDQYGLRVK